MKAMKLRMIVAAYLALALIAVVGCDMMPKARSPQQPTAVPTPIVVVATPAPLPPQVVQSAAADEQVVIDIYARVSPAVVHINSRIIVRDFFLRRRAPRGHRVWVCD